jgi:hypothetical protein
MIVNVNGKPVEISNPAMVEAIRAQLAGDPGIKPPRTAESEIASVKRLSLWIERMRAKPGVFVPIYLRNPLNTVRHWRQSSADRKANRRAAAVACAAAGMPTGAAARVRLTRYGPRTMDDDNLRASLKPVRDGVADHVGVDDAEGNGWDWECVQDKSPNGCYGVRIEFLPERTDGNGNDQLQV